MALRGRPDMFATKLATLFLLIIIFFAT